VGFRLLCKGQTLYKGQTVALLCARGHAGVFALCGPSRSMFRAGDSRNLLRPRGRARERGLAYETVFE